MDTVHETLEIWTNIGDRPSSVLENQISALIDSYRGFYIILVMYYKLHFSVAHLTVYQCQNIMLHAKESFNWWWHSFNYCNIINYESSTTWINSFKVLDIDNKALFIAINQDWHVNKCVDKLQYNWIRSVTLNCIELWNL
jgi:hypothetical protein